MKDVKQNLHRLILGLADDALIYGQRLSEWSSCGPTLEIDIALSNTALSYLGRARMLFAHYSELKDEGKDEDHYAMVRGEREYTNLWIYEIANGDFAHAVLRQYCIDLFETDYFSRLGLSEHQPLAAIAAKTVLESRFSLKRCRDWLDMLAHGTEESHQRLNRALEDLWGYPEEFFLMSEAETALHPQAYCPDRQALAPAWREKFHQTLAELRLEAPGRQRRVNGGRQGVHSDALGHLLADLQYMQRTYPGLKW